MKLRKIAAAVLCFALTAAVVPSQAETESPEFVRWVLDTARGEVGYAEERTGYSKYGAWAGDPYAQWCAEFICWCVDKVDQEHGTTLLKNQYPLYSGSNTGKNWFIEKGRYISRNGKIEGWGSQWLKGENKTCRLTDYTPQPGDLVFFTWDSTEDTDHVALVEYSEVTEEDVIIHVIEGNNPDSVARNEYLLSSRNIVGIGTVQDHADVTIRSGCTGEKVRTLQKNLIKLGFLAPENEDGRCGGKTVEAVKIFQETAGLRPTGIADIYTQNEILHMLDVNFATDSGNWIVDE